MTSPATAIKTEIRELIDLQIQVFGQAASLTSFELEDYRRRAKKIKSPSSPVRSKLMLPLHTKTA